MKKLKTLILATVLIISTGIYCQGNVFLKLYGNTGYDYGRDIKQDNDTGYVITGSSSSFGADNTEAYLLKIDKNGDFLWSHNYGGSGSDWGEGLVITNDSTYAIGGYTNSSGAGGFDFYLMRIDADGSLLWENTYGGSNWDQAFGLVQLPDSGFVLAGESYSFNDGIRSGYLVRTDKFGNLLWETSILEDVPSFFTDISFDGDSIVVCGGIGDGAEESFDGFIYKCGMDGGFGWDRRIGSEYNDYFNAVVAISGFYSFGGARGYNYPTTNLDMWMYRLNYAGTEIFDTTYVNESTELDVIHDIAIRGFDQDYYFVGETRTYGFFIDGKSDIFSCKMSPTLEQYAQNTYGQQGDDIGRAIDRTRDFGVVFLADTKYYSTGGHNIMVVKLNNVWDYPELVGGYEFHDITNSIAETIELEPGLIYPNPFTTSVFLPTISLGTYAIYSLDGKLLLNGIIEGQELDLSNLKSGSYLLTVETPEGVFQQRLIKN